MKLPNKVWKLGARSHDLCGTKAKPHGKYHFAWLHPREGRHLYSWPKTWNLAPCRLDGWRWPPVKISSQFENTYFSHITNYQHSGLQCISHLLCVWHTLLWHFLCSCCENFRQSQQARVMKAWCNPHHIMIHLRNLPRKFEFGSGNDFTFE